MTVQRHGEQFKHEAVAAEGLLQAEHPQKRVLKRDMTEEKEEQHDNNPISHPALN